MLLLAVSALAQVQARWPLRRIDRNYAGEVARRYEYVDGRFPMSDEEKRQTIAYTRELVGKLTGSVGSLQSEIT